MNDILKNIVLYLNYLNSECNLNVSVHFAEDYLKRIPKDIFSSFSPYNFHKNPYCVTVKNGDYAKCLFNQKNIIEKLQCGMPLFNVCHAGVYEFVYPVCKEPLKGFVAVSGYKPQNYNESNILNNQLWENSLEENIPSKLFYCVIPPLVLMIEQLLDECSNNDENEYGMLLNFLNEYHTNISLADLSAHFKCSKSHISHLFKKESGMTIRAYCNNLKLEDAKKLLLTTNLSVTEIGFDAGFNDSSYFIYLFKKKYGITPHQYRQKI